MTSESDASSNNSFVNPEINKLLEDIEDQLNEIAERPYRVMEQILAQTKNQKLIIQGLSEHLENPGCIPAGEEEKKIEHLIQNHVVPQLKYCLNEVLQQGKIETPETSPQPEQRTSTVEEQSSVPKKQKQVQRNFITIAILVGLGVLTIATVVGVPHIEPLCQVVGNCDKNIKPRLLIQEANTDMFQAIQKSRIATTKEELKEALKLLDNIINKLDNELNNINFFSEKQDDEVNLSYENSQKIYTTTKDNIEKRLVQESEWEKELDSTEREFQQFFENIDSIVESPWGKNEQKYLPNLSERISKIEELIKQPDKIPDYSFSYSRKQELIKKIHRKKLEIENKIRSCQPTHFDPCP